MSLTSATLLSLYREEQESRDPMELIVPFSTWKKQFEADRITEMAETNIENFVAKELPIEYTSNEEFVTEQPKTISKPTTKRRARNNIGNTNMDKARNIFAGMMSETTIIPPRKEIISAFVTQLGISPACASTYCHNIKQKYC